MEGIKAILADIGKKNGLELTLDETGACPLELADGRVMLLQERADLDELDFVATLGPVPENIRAEIFTDLLSANFYWRDTFGATLSWNEDIGEVVLTYPLPLANATPQSIETIFTRFIDLQAAWAERLAKKISDAQGKSADDAEEENGGEESGVLKLRV